MALKANGPATDLEVVDRHPDGVGWLAHPEEGIQRTSHALVLDGDTWLVDPLDAPGVDDLLEDLPPVAGVVVLFAQHTRDAVALARRHDVAVHVPRWMAGVSDDQPVPVHRTGTELADTGATVVKVTNSRFWQEAALFDEDDGTLVVPESLGTAPHFLAGDERLGVHPMRRLRPPRTLDRFPADRLLVGHGAGLDDDVTSAIASALETSRSNAPRLYLEDLRWLLPG